MKDTRLTDLDAQLLTALSRDQWSGLCTFAETLGVPMSTVRECLQNLETDGVIAGYMPRLNYGALGFDITAIFELKIATNALSKTTASLQDNWRMVAIYRVTGDHDVVAIGKYESTAELNEQVQAFVTSSEIEQTDVSVVFEAISEFEPMEFESLTSDRR
jgi:DNA-binding Lrp family transcriptional regulator